MRKFPLAICVALVSAPVSTMLAERMVRESNKAQIVLIHDTPKIAADYMEILKLHAEPKLSLNHLKIARKPYFNQTRKRKW